jgi:hypothetical protein
MTKRFKNIYLFGVDYNSSERPEQEFERPCTEFWIGYALAAGMNVFISPQSNLLTYCGYHKGIIYGYTPNYQKPFEGFNAAQPHYWAEYILGAFGGRAIPKETYSHEEWMSELNKFTVQYVHEKCRQKMEMDKANAKKKETTGTREGQAEATSS